MDFLLAGMNAVGMKATMMIVEINDLVWIIILVPVVLGTLWAIAFTLKITRHRGEDLEITHQVEGIEADNYQEAVKKAIKILEEEKKKGKVVGETVRVYMGRSDKEGLDEEEKKKRGKGRR